MPSRPFAELEATPFFRRTLMLRTLYLGLAIVLDLTVLVFVAALHVDVQEHDRSWPIFGYHVYFAFDRPQTYFWMVAILLGQFLLASWAFRQVLNGAGMISLYPEDKSHGRTFGMLTGPQLVKMVHELAEQLAVGPVKRIVINDRPDPNASTAHVFGMGNVVVLHTNLIEIMPAASVRAVVAHEVGHMRRRDSLIYMLLGFPKMFIYLLSAFILWKIGIGIVWFDDWWVLLQRLLFLSCVWSLSTFVMTRLGRLTNLAAQQSEHLADSYAAAACGAEPMLNALLLLGERSEALTVLQKTLSEHPLLQKEGLDESRLLRILKRFPPREMSHDTARQVAARLYIEERLADLRDNLCVPLSEEEIIALAKRGSLEMKRQQEADAREDEELQKERQAERDKEAETEKLLIDWRKYDFDRSGHLDMAEATRLVEAMRKEPTKMLFRQFLEEDAHWKSHPTMRDRVLYVHEHFAPV